MVDCGLIAVVLFASCREGEVTMETTLLIRQLIELDSKERLTVSRALETVQSILLRM